MRVLHVGDGDRRTLAEAVDTAEGPIGRGLGLMFRRSIPEDYALVFRFEGQRERDLHMVFVPFAIDAVWLCDAVVQQVRTLQPWTGRGRAIADMVIELPAGGAEGVRAGDRVVLAE